MDFNEVRNQSNILFGKLHETHVEFYNLWYSHILFTWRWWTLPVVTMLFLQYFPRVSPLLKSVVYSAFGSFVFQPINSWIGLYNKME